MQSCRCAMLNVCHWRTQAENEAIFTAFRTRLLAVWLIGNLLVVTVVTSFDLLTNFAQLLSFMIVFTGGYKITGSVLYLVEDLLKNGFFKCVVPHALECAPLSARTAAGAP